MTLDPLSIAVFGIDDLEPEKIVTEGLLATESEEEEPLLYGQGRGKRPEVHVPRDPYPWEEIERIETQKKFAEFVSQRRQLRRPPRASLRRQVKKPLVEEPTTPGGETSVGTFALLALGLGLGVMMLHRK